MQAPRFLYVRTGSDDKKLVEHKFKSALSDIGVKCDIEATIMPHPTRPNSNYGYVWCSTDEAWNVCLGKNKDGSARVESYVDMKAYNNPIFRQKLAELDAEFDNKEIRWADYDDEVCSLEKEFKVNQTRVLPGLVDFKEYGVFPLEHKKDSNLATNKFNITFKDTIPNWLTEDAVAKEYSKYVPTGYPKVTMFDGYIALEFPRQTLVAIGLLNFKKFVEFRSGGEKIVGMCKGVAHRQ